MKDLAVKHGEVFEILFYHLDRNGRVSLRALMNFMQATANMHGKILGTSLDDLSEESYTWVFSRFHISVARYPSHYDKISVNTWRSDSKKCFAYREFEVLDENDNLIAAATASAVLIDKQTRKPTEIPDRIKSQFAPGLGRALQDDFLPLKTLKEPQNSICFRVRLSDIDMNNHVNNTSYVDWIVESVPENILMGSSLVSCEIGYTAEAFYGDKIECFSAPADIITESDHIRTFLHRLVRVGDNTITTIAITKWKKEYHDNKSSL